MQRRLFFTLFLLLFSQLHLLSKEAVHSFDVFDTLVGRLYKDPESVFRLVEERYPFPGFTERRVAAYAGSDGTLDSIYENFVRQNGLSFEEGERLKAFEFKMELENVFPILPNLLKVQEGDLLISDTYYTKAELEEILQAIGLKKRIHLFATPNGKRFGTIWPKLKKQFHIISHLGDNRESDVLSPRIYGIQGLLCQKSDYTRLEKRVNKAGLTALANLMRVLRLSNPYKEDSLKWHVWNEQAEYNVPILILGSLELDGYCRGRKIERLLFSARGCCHFIKIFQALFPEYQSIYFETSRYIYLNPTAFYVDYVNFLYGPKTLIVDEIGSGRSCRKFFQKNISLPLNYVSLLRSFDQLPTLMYIGALSHSRHYGFEALNYDLKGSLIGYNERGCVRANPEYPLDEVLVAHDCIERALVLLPRFKVFKSDAMVLRRLMKEVKNHPPVLFKYHLDYHQ